MRARRWSSTRPPSTCARSMSDTMPRRILLLLACLAAHFPATARSASPPLRDYLLEVCHAVTSDLPAREDVARRLGALAPDSKEPHWVFHPADPRWASGSVLDGKLHASVQRARSLPRDLFGV